MSAVATTWAKAVAKENDALSPADKRTLLCLARHHTIKNGFSARSYADIAAETMDCLRTAKSSVARLADFGFIEKQAQRKGSRQGANRYFLNFGVFRVQNCTLKSTPSGCSSQTPDVVHPVHPEKMRQGANMHHPYAHTRARFKSNSSFQGSTFKIGGRHA